LSANWPGRDFQELSEKGPQGGNPRRWNLGKHYCIVEIIMAGPVSIASVRGSWRSAAACVLPGQARRRLPYFWSILSTAAAALSAAGAFGF